MHAKFGFSYHLVKNETFKCDYLKTIKMQIYQYRMWSLICIMLENVHSLVMYYPITHCQQTQPLMLFDDDASRHFIINDIHVNKLPCLNHHELVI